MKNLTGGAGASDSVGLKKAGELKGCAQRQAKSMDAISDF
jgi:hypothetical protein